jgi:hypothetical protein
MRAYLRSGSRDDCPGAAAVVRRLCTVCGRFSGSVVRRAVVNESRTSFGNSVRPSRDNKDRPMVPSQILLPKTFGIRMTGGKGTTCWALVLMLPRQEASTCCSCNTTVAAAAGATATSVPPVSAFAPFRLRHGGPTEQWDEARTFVPAPDPPRCRGRLSASSG